MLEVILLIAAVAIGLIVVMNMDVEPRTPRAETTATPSAAQPVAPTAVSVAEAATTVGPTAALAATAAPPPPAATADGAVAA